jgi:hypothetical protein
MAFWDILFDASAGEAPNATAAAAPPPTPAAKRKSRRETWTIFIEFFCAIAASVLICAENRQLFRAPGGVFPARAARFTWSGS